MRRWDRSQRSLPVLLLWQRATLRRLRRGATIVLSLAMMSTATVGALVGGDTLGRLFIADAEAEWGSVDVEVRSAEAAVIDESLARMVVVEAGAAVTAGAPRLILQGVARGQASRERVLVLGLGSEESQFPRLRPLAGIGDPVRLDGSGAIVNQRLAQRLGLEVGQSVTLTVAAPEWREQLPTRAAPRVHPPQTREVTVSIDGVVADIGVADLHRTPNVLMRRDVLQRTTGLGNRVTAVHLTSARPGGRAAEAVVDELAPVTRQLGLDATPVRADALSIAEDEDGLFRSILLMLAALVVAAAAVAAFGLLVALGEQRAGELVVLRALGARRRLMAGLLVAESVLYGVVGALLGAAAGIPFGTVVSSALADHFADLNEGRGREQVLLQPIVDPVTVVLGCVIVAAVAGLAGWWAARVVLSLDPADVLRGAVGRLQPPGDAGRRALALLGGGTYVLGLGTVTGGGILYIGLTLVLAAYWLHRRRSTADQTRFDQRAAACGAAWSLAGALLLGDLGAGVQSGFGTIITAGIVAIACVSVLLSRRLSSAMRWVRVYAPAGPPQAALRTAAANAQFARRRAGTVIATFGIALFMLSAMSVLGSAQGIGLDRQAGGFDVIGTSVGDVDSRKLASLPEVASLAGVPESLLPETAFSVDRDGRQRTVPYPVRLIGANAGLAASQSYGLASHAPGLTTARAALNAVVNDRDKAVLDRAALPEGARVGDDVVIDIGPSPREFRLVAVLDTFLLRGALVNETEFGQLVPDRGETMVLASASEGVSEAALAATLEAVGGDQGLTVDTVDTVRDEVIAANRTFTDTFAVILGLALIVALVSVAAYVVLTARERRAELAVLRALGLRRRMAVLTLAAEPILTGGLGATIGLAVGLVYLRVLFAVGFSELAFIIDWPRVGVVAAVTLLALAAASLIAAAAAAPRDVAAELRDIG